MNNWHLFVGRVSLPDGRAAAGAHVMVGQSSVPLPEIAVMADKDGAFKLMLPEGTFGIRAFAEEGRLSANQTVHVPHMKTAAFELEACSPANG